MSCFIFGDGDQIFMNLPGALDVVGHEFTHGVDNHLAGLVYENQSGALDEHIADFMRCMVDRDDWLAGDGIVRDTSKIALPSKGQTGECDWGVPLPPGSAKP